MRQLKVLPILLFLYPASFAFADSTYQTLPFSQNWTNTGLITTNDSWSGVPGIIGYRGDGLAAGTGVDPQTVLTEGTPVVDINANQTNPSVFNTGGPAEFELTNPVVGLAGSGTAKAPYLLLHLNTTGMSNVRVQYNLRDIDGSTDNATQQFALQYRVGTSGNFINLPTGYVADVSSGPSLATLVTAVDVTLPAAANNQAQVQVRIITTDAAGNDEFVGVDDIQVTGGGETLPLLSINDVSQNEGDAGTTSFTFTVSLNIASASNVTFTVNTQDGSATTANSDYVALVNVPGSITAGQLSTTVTVTVNGDTANELSETFFVNLSSVTGAGAGDAQGLGTINNDEAFSCTGGGVSFIHDIQGNGNAAALTGVRTIEGIVVGKFQGANSLGGFFVQEEDADVDANPATSEGIFVFTNLAANVGDRVRVQGTVTEFFELTEMGSVTALSVCSTSNPLPAVSTLTFPVPAAVGGVAYLERLEGMRVVTSQPMVVTENFDHGNFGEILLSANSRLFIPTHSAAPGAAAVAQLDLNNRSKILLDDASDLTRQSIVNWLFPEGGGLSASNTARSGEVVDGPISGIMSFDFSEYRIVPTSVVEFHTTITNPRPVAPTPVGGNLRITAFNLLNYFSTLDTGAAICGPSANIDCRGANTAAEFTRQRTKIINAIVTMDPHVLGVTELENNNVNSINDLISGLNAATFSGKYAAIFTSTIGTDAIRVAFIYQPAVVSPVGTFAVLSTNAAMPSRNRPPLAQTFERIGPKSSLQRFTVVINHWKSKGSACTSVSNPGEIADPDTNDGQGNCNLSRTSVAQALINWLATNPTADPTPAADRKIFIMGDLNAYKNENPISALTSTTFTKPPVIMAGNPNATYVNLIDSFLGAESYSYVFMGESGYLDHALANPLASRMVTGVSEWHINADEPIAIDYNTDWVAGVNKTPAQIASLYDTNPYRSSDHDPVLFGFNPLCGDFDDDGDVDNADKTLLTNQIGQAAVQANRRYNLDADGFITTNDYRQWLVCQRAFGQ